MSLPEWPCELRCCVLREGWQQNPISPHIRTEMDDGEYAVTRRLSHTRYIQSAAWEFTAFEFELFKWFWTIKLDSGKSWFTYPYFQGARTRDETVRFSGEPPWQVISPANGVFHVQAELEIRCIPLPEDAERFAMQAHLKGEDTDNFMEWLEAVAGLLEE